MDRLQGYYSRNSRKYGGTKEVWRAAEKGHSMVERGYKTSYEIEKAIIQEVAERSNTTEQRTVSVSQRCMHTSYQTGQRKEAWSEYRNQLEGMRNTEAMKSFYKKVKSMRERDQPYCPITTIKDAQGQIITDKHQIKQIWGGYFEGLLHPNEDTRDNNFSARDILEHEPEILRSEVEESLKSAKTGKAPGIDGISIEIIKAAGEAGVELLWRVCRAVWKDGTAPTEWRQSIIIPIWKRKGDRRECSQYRGISLLSQPSKVFARILEKRIRYIVEPQLSENQFGFRKNKGCSDAIFILRQLQEKHIEWNKPLYMAFIDQEKAFDRVVRAELWKCLTERGIFGELLRAVQSLYICSQAAVKQEKEKQIDSK